MQVFIMSGIPGSGKSHWIQCFSGFVENRRIVCSADYYHMDDGVYRFRPENISKAHNACLMKYINTLQNEIEQSTLFVDNTNLTVWEISPYYRLAEVFGHKVEIIRIWADPLVAARRNVHNVPTDRVFSMYQNMLSERFPAHWKVRTVIGE